MSKRLSDSDTESSDNEAPPKNNVSISSAESCNTFFKSKNNPTGYKRHDPVESSNSDGESGDGESSNYAPNKKFRTDSYSDDLNSGNEASSISFNNKAASTDVPNTSLLSSKAAKMMKSYGYQVGMGLGKTGSGRVAPVEAFNQSGRKGLGFQPHSKGQEYTGDAYNPKMEVVVAEEFPQWLENRSPDSEEPLDSDLLEAWMKKGPPKKTIDDETNFCDPAVLSNILSLKTALDNIKAEDFLKVRSACNPYEKIAGVFFMNRAAMKMANMDAVFDFMFTEPKTESGEKMVKNGSLLYFADVCAGPGGFTEYVLWRKKWLAKGFGFTLKACNDFKISDMLAAPTDSFTPYYGVKGDGNVFDPENLESLKTFVLRNTNDAGVHFMMADGGFDVGGDENIQEILSKQLYLCQCVTALSLVRTGGNFVVKVFDLFTEFSVGLIYLMYKCFKKICIHKPHTSRPANSERYVICKWKKANCETIERHLLFVNNVLNDANTTREDVRRLVPLDVLCEDREFFKYIYDSNNSIAEQQKNSLLKIIGTHNKTIDFQETRHLQIRKDCLAYWKIPDKIRCKMDSTGDNMVKITELINSHLHITAKFTSTNLEKTMKSKETRLKSKEELLNQIGEMELDWHFVYLSEKSMDVTYDMPNGKCFFLLGCDSSLVKKYDGSSWTRELTLKLPANTLIIAEKVKEFKNEHRTQMNSRAFHIIDAYCLGGISVYHMPISERYKMISLFCTAVNKDNQNNLLPLRCKKLYSYKNIWDEVQNLDIKKFKNGDMRPVSYVPNMYNNRDLYYSPKKLILLTSMNFPYRKLLSKSRNMEYVFKHEDRRFEATFEMPLVAISNTDNSFQKRKEISLGVMKGDDFSP